MTQQRVPPATIVCAVMLALLASASLARAADLWASPTDPAVITNNDCGFVTAAHGGAQIRRSFHAQTDQGVVAHAADRVNTGDELLAPPGGRIEMVSGNNVVLVVGDNSRVKLGGLRSFTAPDGKAATRLDIELVSGEARIQVGKNEEKTECLLASLGGADTLVLRGDVVISSASGWMASIVSGEALGRVRRGTVVGAPFQIAPGRSVGGNGETPLGVGVSTAMRARLPFSFEVTSAALPPAPSMGSLLEAP